MALFFMISNINTVYPLVLTAIFSCIAITDNFEIDNFDEDFTTIIK